MPVAFQTHTNYYRPPQSANPKPPKKRKVRRYIVPVVLVILATIFLQHFVYIKQASGHEAKPKIVRPLSPAQVSAMATGVNQVINNNSDVDTAVSIADLQTGSHQNYGLPDPFEAASTAKLITAADYLHGVEEGTYSLSQTVNGNTAQYELQQMIVVSDDGAWQSFNNLMGHPNLQAYASGQGLTDYDPDANTMPASDIALLLQKLYQGQLLNKSDTQLLLGYMGRANNNGYIGPAVPGDAKFYHKTGLLDDRVHDAAIIDNGQRPIVLVIFTRDDGDQDYQRRAEIMQQITKIVLRTYSIN